MIFEVVVEVTGWGRGRRGAGQWVLARPSSQASPHPRTSPTRPSTRPQPQDARGHPHTAYPCVKFPYQTNHPFLLWPRKQSRQNQAFHFGVARCYGNNVDVNCQVSSGVLPWLLTKARAQQAPGVQVLGAWSRRRPSKVIQRFLTYV